VVEILHYLYIPNFKIMKKNILLNLVILLSSVGLYSQVWENNLLEASPDASFQEKNDFFSEYKKTHPYKKGNGFNPYERNLDFILQRTSKNSTFNPTSLYVEWLKEKNKAIKSITNANWIAKGPINTPIILSNGKKRGNGRVNCIAFDPFDANIIWIGSPAGGLWKSNDGGNSWETETDNLPVIGVTSIAIHPTDPDIMYIATGDAHGADTYSIGVLKSNDGGVNWNTTGLSYNINQEKRINKVVIHPNSPDSVYVVTDLGIMVSSDGGSNFNVAGDSDFGRWRDIEFKPGDPNIVYAVKHTSGGSQIHRTTNGGVNWSTIHNGLPSTDKNRPLIAVTPSNPNVIYLLFSANDDGFHGVYKSSDGGDSWVLQSDSPNILAWETDGTGNGGQSWYDLSFGVSTINENLVYVGGVNLWKSTDGGITWDIDGSSGNSPNYSYMHVDQHALEFNPINDAVYAGNDGGLYHYMDNLNTWVDISDGLEISQFYKLGLSRSNPNRLVAGAQDNGTEMLTNSTWDAIRGADGMECAIDPFDEDVIYSSSQYGGMRKSTNGGNNWFNIKPVSYSGSWVTPYKIHPNNNDLIVAGYKEVYRSLTAGATWDSVSYNVSGGNLIKTIALAPSDQNYIYAATYSTLKVTTDAGATWTSIKSGLPNYNITDVVVSNTNPDHLWVTFSEYASNHKVYESLDRGANWTNITGSNLPNLPVNCIIHQGQSNNDLYIGTDVGVYYKNDNIGDWTPFMTGLPNVIVRELEIHYTKGTISAATYGRGVWESPLNTLPSTNINDLSSIDFSIYPNPTKNEFLISFNNLSGYEVKIYNIEGKLMMTQKLTRGNHKISCEELASGYYLVELKNNLDFSSRKKLIIK